MEINKITSGKYVNYKTTETEENKDNNEVKQEMNAIANQFYADVTAVSTDEDAAIETGDEAVADKDTYNIVKNYVSGGTEETGVAAVSEETDEAVSGTEETSAANAVFSDEEDVMSEVESLVKDMKAQLKAKGATDAELSKLDYLSAHFDAETFLSDNAEATLSDLENEITKEVEKLTGKSL